ncbi:hypothetical protein QFC19_004465 [Naganishia cerealis]|uniref:Uncharacterized protein n=1 Tax=Naganishia cerealis TaxID=610337 RepID=A0ACC2VX50_9TREE|nr:hypothetical protein QFC19_004465 [Naganishia cerealis]
MSFSARTRRSNLSNKVPNVKLRPAPVLSKSSSNNLNRSSKYEQGEEEIGLMDKEVVRRLNEADNLADENSEDVELEHARPSQPFEGRIICFTAVQSTVKADLIKKLTAMGVSKVEGNLTLETSALISETFGSVKYQAAVQNRIPVFTPEWIYTIHSHWLSGMDIPDIFSKVYRQFYLRPFAGLKISISGIEPLSKRTEMMENISSMGGVYSKTLDPSCTHLVIAQPDMEENESADLDAIRTSKVDWALRRNAKAEQARRRRLREIQAGRLRDMSADECSEERIIMIVWEGWFWDCEDFNGRFSEDRWRLENHPKPPKRDFSERERERLAKEEEKTRQEQEERERLVKEMMAEDVKQNTKVKVEPAYNVDASGELDMQRLNNVPETELEQAKLRKRPRSSTATNDTKNDSRMLLVDELMSSLGGKVEAEPASRLLDSSRSLITPEAAIPNAPTAKVEENVSQEDRTRKRARLAPAIPTHSSVTSAGLAPRPTPPERFSVVHTSRASAFNETNPPNTKPVILAQKSVQPSSMAKRQAVSDMVQDVTLNPNLFKNLVFSHDVQAGYEAMEAAIVGSGGKLIPLDDVRQGADVAYLISRVERVATVIPKLKSKTQRVTESWVEMCLTENRLIPPEEHVAYRPLSTPMPVPVCKEAGNPKHIKAVQWGLPVLQQDWLFHVAKTGDASTEGFELPLPAQPEENGRSDTKLTDSRRALGANSTANMSMLKEQSSFFGMSEGSEEKSQKFPAKADNASEKSCARPGKSVSQLTASRQLGLVPTVADLAPMLEEHPAQVKATAENNSLPSKSFPMISADVQAVYSTSYNSTLRADTGPSEKPGATDSPVMKAACSISNITSGRLNSTTSAPAELIENMIKQLEPERLPIEAGTDFPIRRRRAQSKPISTSTKSGSTSPAKIVEPLNIMFKSGAGPTETQQPHETAEESFRVQYRDPAAEKEKQRLLAGFRDKEPERESQRTTRSRAK